MNLTYPGNLTVSYEYDADNRLIKVTDWLGHNTTYNYDIGGRLISTTSPGVMTIYEYDNASRLSKLTNWNAVNLTVVSYFEYEYDENSNRERIGTYIPFSNLTFARNTTGYTYNAGNQLVTAGNKTVTYDDNGNMLTISGTPSTNLTYNALNQLTQYSDGSVNLTFSYDVLGNRISKTSAGVTTKYIVNPTGLPSVLAETDAGGNVTSYYIYGLGLVSKINATSNSTYFYQYDGLGSTAAITDTNGTVVNKYAYDDFGNVATNSVEGIGNVYKYVGQYGVQTDAGDLLYMRARYYKPSVGRFINLDPIGLAGGLNQYSYVDGNPIGLIDPTGLSPAPDGSTNEFCYFGERDIYEREDNVETLPIWEEPAFIGVALATGGGPTGWIFGRGGAGLLNSNPYVRIGWGWKGTRAAGRLIFRIAIGSKRGPIHWHFP